MPEKQIKEGFKTRTIVIRIENGEYPQELILQASQDKCSMMDKVKVGQIVTAQINLMGRRYIDKQGEDAWFNYINVWRLDVESGNSDGNNESKSYINRDYDPSRAEKIIPSAVEDDEDDLPFWLEINKE